MFILVYKKFSYILRPNNPNWTLKSSDG